jgi:hypothetical protein
MDFNHENGVDAPTSTPNSDGNFGTVESKSHINPSPEITVPQPFSAIGQAATEQLKALGYCDGDRVYLRALGPTPQKLDATFPNLPIGRLEALNHQGHGIYFVVNGGGHCDNDVTACRAIFYEHDDLEIEKQLDLWRLLNLPVPTIQVRTGGKSIHSYWAFREPLEPNEWRALQADLLEMANADRSIKNPSRVMRLAGFTHQKTGVVASIETNSGVLYDAAKLRELVPVAQPKPDPAPEPRRVPSGAPTNLSSGGGAIADFLLQKIYPRLGPEQIYGGCNLSKTGKRWQGSCPWHDSKTGTAFWVKVTEDGATYRYACPTCTGNKFHGPVAYVHALRTGRHESPRGDDFIQAVIALADLAGTGNEFLELVAGFGSGGMKPVINGQSLEPPDEAIDGLTTETETAEDSAMPPTPATPARSPAPIAANVIDPFAHFGLPTLSQQQAMLQQSGSDDGLSTAESRAGVEVLLGLAKELPRGLLPAFEPAFEAMAKSFNIPAAAYIGMLLPMMASQIPSGVKLELAPNSNQFAPAILNTALVGEPASGKSKIRELMLEVLHILQKEKLAAYKKEQATYKKELREYELATQKNRKGKVVVEQFTAYGEADDREEKEEPTAPVCRRHYVNNTTIEALIKRLVQNPGRSILWTLDELAAMLNGANAHRGGKGADVETILSLNDGGVGSLDRAGDEPLSYEASASICGGFQPSVLKKQVLADQGTDNGLWARFLFIEVPTTKKNRPGEGVTIDVKPVLLTTFRNLNEFPMELTLRLSAEAQEIAGQWHDETEEYRINPSLSTYERSSWAKSQGYAYRVALIAHCGEAAANGQTSPGMEISAATLKAAIRFVRYCLGQGRAIFASFGATSDDEEAARISQVIENYKGRTISHRDIRPKLPKIKNRSTGNWDKADAETCKKFLRKLCDLGYAKPVIDGDFSKVEVLDPGLDPILDPSGPTLDPSKVQSKPLLSKDLSVLGPNGPKFLEKEDEIEEWVVA